jgi:nicotinamide phosphoribosyltransferase
MFKPNALYYVDAYKVGHKAMLAPGTTRLYGNWIPRSVKHAPKGVSKVVSFGQQLTWKWLHDIFQENFFNLPKEEAMQFGKDMSMMLMIPYDDAHFGDLYELGYLPMKVKSLPEGIETNPNIVHMSFINTVDGFAWLVLYLETIVSSLAWKPATAATIALQYRRNLTEWVMKTDPANAWLIPYLAHDFSARGLNPHDMVAVGLGHATSFRGSDTIITIPAARYYYGEPMNEVVINSVNASEHSVTCTGIFYYEGKLRKGLANDAIEEYYSFDAPCEGSIEDPDYKAIAEWMNLRDWLKRFPVGILSVVSDTFDLWKLITFILPRLKDQIMARDGKLVIRPDSGDPVDIICGNGFDENGKSLEIHPIVLPYHDNKSLNEWKGVIELLWDIFGGTINKQGYKVLDPHIGAIYGDSINLERQLAIYERLAAKGFACTNIVLGVGSFTYQFNTRDTMGYAAKGAWFEGKQVGQSHFHDESEIDIRIEYDIYKDPITDDGTKKSLKGRCAVHQDENGEYYVKVQCTEQEENEGLLQVIYEDGKFYNQITLTEVRANLEKL